MWSLLGGTRKFNLKNQQSPENKYLRLTTRLKNFFFSFVNDFISRQIISRWVRVDGTGLNETLVRQCAALCGIKKQCEKWRGHDKNIQKHDLFVEKKKNDK